jgi:hypothetical protein
MKAPAGRSCIDRPFTVIVGTATTNVVIALLR